MSKATYFIAQHIRDVFRNEPRNIGVFVELNGERQARFLGEVDDNEVDGRKLKSFSYPNVYRQWISHWRKALQRDSFENLMKSNQANYRVIEGGEVGDIGNDSIGEISKYLYSLLVSDGGYLEATKEADDSQVAATSLENEVLGVFREHDLLSDNVAHPLKKNVPIEGETIIYKPTFTQENGQLYIIETIDFTQQVKSRARDHAGYSAFMYKDILSRRLIEPISIIKVRDDERDIEEVKAGMLLLQHTSTVVDWQNAEERENFVEGRKSVAFA